MRILVGVLIGSVLMGGIRQTARQPLLILEHFGGEGGPVIAATRDIEALPVFPHPGATAAAHAVAAFKDQVLDWDRPRTVIYAVGEAEILPDATRHEAEVVRLDGARILSAGVETVDFEAGEKLEVLAYHAEGYYYFRHRGRLLSMFGETMRIHREPQTETWIHLTGEAASPGWIKVDGETVRVIKRRF